MKIRILLKATVLVCVQIFSLNAIADTSVWKVSKADNYFYLGGTIHLLSKDDHPLPEEFAEAYKLIRSIDK